MANKYYPIWRELKQKKKCTVSAHPLLFTRVIKGVIKEKGRDLAFKVANDLDSIYLVIAKDIEKHTVTFRLKQRVGIADIVVV